MCFCLKACGGAMLCEIVSLSRSPTPLLQSVKATLQPVLSAVCEGLPRNRAFAAALPKLEKLRKTQEAICALHFRCDMILTS